MRRRLPAAVVVAAAAYVVAFALGEHDPHRVVAHDIYAYWYPNLVYALHGLTHGGRGLFWNPFQVCGEPFFATSSTGLLYPANVSFLFLDPPHALRAVLLVNLVIGGVGMVGLLRELGVKEGGAIAGGLAFVLGPNALYATTWMPTVQAPYMWMPATLWAGERLVRVPSVRAAAILGLAFAMALLPGHPQFALFAGELVGFRLLWMLGSRTGVRRLPRAAAALSLAVVTMLLVTAVQYLPSLEVAGESVRHGTLAKEEIGVQSVATWDALASLLRMRSVGAPFEVASAIPAVAAVMDARRRPAAGFYLAGAILFTLFAQGDANPIGALHLASPMGQMFRGPGRMLFVTSFCIAVLAGLGVDAVARGRRGAGLAAIATVAACRAWLGPLPTATWVFAGVFGLAGAVARVPRARAAAVALAVAPLALAPIVMPYAFAMRLLPDDAPLDVHAELFTRVRARLTPQDRVSFAIEQDFGFVAKTASRFRTPTIIDYEPQMSLRYAELLTAMRTGMILTSVNQVYYMAPWKYFFVRRPLLDIVAARYVLMDAQLPRPTGVPFQLIDQDDGLRLYENASALPRAYYVPRLSVVANSWLRLATLLNRDEDPRDVAIVGAPPASGFLGVDGNTERAEARIVVDDPERVVVETTAPARGFLFLADQWFPGWTARVNGSDAPVLLANHAFRAVEVPAGPVRVEFRYRPRLVPLGAAISGVTLALVAWVLCRRNRRSAEVPTAAAPEAAVA